MRLAGAAIVGLALTIAAPVAVHAQERPLGPGTFALDGGGSASGSSLYLRAVRDALVQAGFIELPDGRHGRYEAQVSVDRQQVGLARVDPKEPGAVVSPFGIYAALPSHKTVERDLTRVRVTLTLLDPVTREPLWTGSAMTVARDGDGRDRLLDARKLADVIVARFPERLPGTITVP